MATSYNELFGKGTHSADADLHGHWEMQETSGTTLADSSGNSNDMNGTNVTGLDVTGPTNWLPSGINCGSTYTSRVWSQTVSLTNTDHTIAIWEQTTPGLTNADEGVAFSATTGNSNYDLIFSRGGGGGTTYNTRSQSNGNQLNNSTNYNQATSWYHRAVAVDSSGVSLYTDGSQTNSSASDYTSATEQTRLGIGAIVRAGFVTVDYFEGYLAGAAYFTRKLTSDEISEIHSGPEPINISSPVISGLPNDGEVIYLTSPGIWDTQDNGVVTYTYQWQRDGVDISGETGTTYTWTLANDAGSDITCVVTAVNDGGSDPAVTSSNAVQDKSYNKLFGKGNKSADADLFGYWEMQETSGTTLTDSSGNSNDMSCDFTVSSASGPSTWLPSAVDFGATTDTRIAQLSGSFGTNARTMMLWEYPSGFTASYDGDSFGLTNGGSDWQRMQRQGTNVSVRCVAGANSITSGVKAQDQWDHHAFVTTSTTLSSYLNGSLDTTGTGALVGGQDRLAIGGLVRNGSADVAWWAGRLAGACMFDRELTPEEIDEHRTGPEPINLTAPSINVPTALTDTLTCTNGTWDSQNNGTVVLSFQWLRDGIPISGAVSNTYNMTTDDLGTQISCRVKASNNGGYDSLEITESNKVTTAKEQTKQVTANQEASVTYNDSTLLGSYDLDFNPGSGDSMAIVTQVHAGRGSVTSVVYDPGGPDEANFTKISDSDLSARDITLWMLLDADIVKGETKTIRATCSQTTKWGLAAASFTGCDQVMPADLQVDETTTSSKTSTIDDTNTVDYGMSVALCSPHSNRSIGVAAGQTLFDSTSLWVNGYRSATSYKVATGTSTTSTFSHNNNTYWTVNALALAPAPYPVNTAAPDITGTVAVGDTLTCSTGTWSNPGTGSLTYQYQWVRDKDFIPNANSSTYILRPADAGYRISCVVVASNDSGYDPESWTQSDWVATSNSYNQIFGLGQHAIDANLHGYWEMQETSGTTLADSSGNSNDMTGTDVTGLDVTGPTNWLPSGVNCGNTFTTRSWSQTVSLTNTDHTIAIWEQTTPALGNADEGTAFSATTGNSNYDLIYSRGGGGGTTYNTRTQSNGTQVNNSTNYNQATSWYHRAVAVDSSGTSIYTDGSQTNSSASDLTSATAQTRLGIGAIVRAGFVTIDYFEGYLAGAAYFTRKLAADEISEVHSGPEPINITEPTVTGTAVPGQVLTTDNGVWDNMNNGAVSYTYSWYYSLVGDETDEVQISGETGATFTIPSGYENVWVRSRVAATNDGGLDEAEITASEFVQVTPSRVYVRPLPIVPDNFEIDYSHPLNDGLIKWIPFWNRKGGGDFDDVVSGRVSTTPSASSTLRSADMVYAPQGGRVPLWEAGTDRYIEWLDSDTGALGVANLTDFTVAAWVKNDPTRTTNKYICIAGEGVVGDWSFYIAGADDPSIGWTTGSGSNYQITTFTDALAGFGDEWVHLAVAVYGVNEVGQSNSSKGTDSYIALYVNGDLFRSDAIASWSLARYGDTTGTFGVGNRKTDYGRTLDNAISDLRVYNKAIPRQIKDLYEVSSRPGEYNRQGVIRSPLGGNRRLMPMGGEVTPPPPSTGYRIYENYYRQLLAGYRGF